MIDINDIRIVHVEASSRCNSHCPMCSRYTADGYLQPGLDENDLSSDVFYKLFTSKFAAQLEHVYFSGVYGDPCLNKLLPEFVKHLIDSGCQSVSIDTNGGYRDTEWWAKLAHSRVLINFAIDGADNETLDKYRIGVRYDKVIDNMRAFIQAGGQAQWNFIVFKHNEHQIETAEKLAKELGAKFRIKVTQKFVGNKNHKVMKQGQHVFTLEPPDNPKYRHGNVGTKEHNPVSLYKFNINNYTKLNGYKVNCKSLQRREVYLAAKGVLVPCCYLGTYSHDSPGSWQFNQEYNLSDFDLNTQSVDSVLAKMYTIKDRWDQTVENGNLITCLRTCGEQENTTLYFTDKLTKENILKQ